MEQLRAELSTRSGSGVLVAATPAAPPPAVAEAGSPLAAGQNGSTEVLLFANNRKESFKDGTFKECVATCDSSLLERAYERCCWGSALELTTARHALGGSIIKKPVMSCKTPGIGAETVGDSVIEDQRG